MKKKKKEYPLPLTILEYITKYPDIWEKVFPSVYFNTGYSRYCRDNGKEELMHLAYTLRKWRQCKQIFEFDSELCDILFASDKINEEVPIEVINRLLYDCFYVKLPDHFIRITPFESDLGMEHGRFDNIDGFFYYVEGISVIIVLLFSTGHSSSFSFDIYEGASLKECVDKYWKASSDAYKLISFVIQCVLYLCADNADIRENPIQKEIYKPPASNKPKEIKDKYSELRKWDVGFRYGSAIKKVKQQEKLKNQSEEQSDTPSEHHKGSNARKRTHVRRGHYHHFWRGSKQDGTRELVLKWLSPVVINAEFENIVTIRKVKP